MFASNIFKKNYPVIKCYRNNCEKKEKNSDKPLFKLTSVVVFVKKKGNKFKKNNSAKSD